MNVKTWCFVATVVVVSACGGGGTPTPDAGGTCGPGEPNNTRETATTVSTDGGVTHGCVGGSADDKDFYEFTAPTSTAGGLVRISLTNVSTAAAPEMTIYAASDNGEIASKYETDPGKSLSMWLTVASGAKYRVALNPFASSSNISYDLALSYTGLADAYEPNNRKEDAKPLTLGTAIQASAAAVSAASTFTDADAEDWFKATVAAGTATVLMSNVPADYGCDVEVFDAAGTGIAEKYSTSAGANCQVDLVSLTAGDIYLKVHEFAGKPLQGGDGAPPASITGQYTLKVSQP